jgi:hypothetical protein
MSRGTLCVLAVLALIWAVWRVGTEATREVGVLRVSDVGNSDRYVTLWAVRDGGWVWLRAARPDRRWLEWLGEQREVELELDGESRRYTAEVFPEDPQADERVDELMREQYPWADPIRELLLGDDTVPIRLVPVE